MESLRRQNYPNLEHIVLDACSTDGTLDLLAAYSDVTVISEPDEGSHDALNKGISRATGEIIGELNTDDLYPDNILEQVGRMFAADETIDVVVGHSLVFEDNEFGKRCVSSGNTHPRENGLWLPELTFGIPGICGCFFRRRVFTAKTRFQNEYRLSADRRLLIGLRLAGVKSARLDRPTILYRRHSGSATINPEMSTLMPLSREYFRMAAELAQETRDRPEFRRIFLAWHAVEGAKLMARHFGAGRFREGAEILSTLARHNRWLAVDFARGLMLRRSVRKLVRNDARRARESFQNNSFPIL
jgi:glycosyltransferase involved in cell wall biosynthesis